MIHHLDSLADLARERRMPFSHLGRCPSPDFADGGARQGHGDNLETVSVKEEETAGKKRRQYGDSQGGKSFLTVEK